MQSTAMPIEDEMKSKIVESARRNLPSAEISRVDVEPITDSHGDKSLSVTVVVRERPSRAEVGKLVRIVDEFRSWLAARDDERFPYFHLLSEEDERELHQIAS